jgi:hypothetical protein
VAEPRDIDEKIGLDYLVKAGKLRPAEAPRTPEPAPSSQQPAAPSSQQPAAPSSQEPAAPSSQEPAAPSSAPDYESDIHAFAARSVLLSLQRHEGTSGAEEPGTRLFAIGREVGMSAEVLVPLCRRLESSGLVRILQWDTVGDHQVVLTDDARQLLSTTSEAALLERLRSV